MNFLKRTPKIKTRIVQACGGYIPQIYGKDSSYEYYSWKGVDKSMCIWESLNAQKDYCLRETEQTAQEILNSYIALKY